MTVPGAAFTASSAGAPTAAATRAATRNGTRNGAHRCGLPWIGCASKSRRCSRKRRALLKDPWRARDAYISVVLDRSDASVSQFFSNHATRMLNEQEQVSAFRLLEM